MTTAIKAFEQAFIANLTASTESEAKWFELSLEAPSIFGNLCFDKGSDDYQALRDVTMSAYAHTQGGMPTAPDRKDKSAKANEAREKRKAISTTASVYIGRMAGYFSKANGIERVKVQSLDKYLAALLKKVKEGMGFKAQKDVVALIEASMSIVPEKKTKTKASNVVTADFAPKRRAVRQQVAA